MGVCEKEEYENGEAYFDPVLDFSVIKLIMSIAKP